MSNESINPTAPTPMGVDNTTTVGELGTPSAPRPERIIVALDASPHSLAALRAAAQLAAATQAELYGLFIEDNRVLHLCNSPFSREVGRFTAGVRPLDSVAIEREMRVMAVGLRRTMARVAAEMHVHWSFQVRRGGIEQELLNEAAGDVLLLSLGRGGWLAARGLGSTATALIRQTMRPLLLLGDREDLRYPLTLVYNGSPSAERALTLAARLAQRSTGPLNVILVASTAAAPAIQERLERDLCDMEITPVFVTVETDDEQDANEQTKVRALLKQSTILPAEYAPLLAELPGPVLLVP